MVTMELAETTDVNALDSFAGCFQSNPVGLFAVNREGCITQLNSRAADIFGFATTGEARGISLSRLEFFFSNPVLQQMYGLLASENSFKVECFPGSNLAGHFAYYSLSCNTVCSGDGTPDGVFGVIEEVTSEMKHRQELKDRIAELSILAQISQAVSSAQGTEDVLKIILTGVTARQGLGFNRAFLFLLDNEGKTLNGRLAIGPADAEEAGKIWGRLEQQDRTLAEILSMYQEESERSQQSLTNLIGNVRIDATNGSLFARAVRDKTSIVVEYETELDYITDRILQRLGERQVAMTPLVSRDRPIGLLVVDNAITHEPITEHDRRFLKLIADQTAAAVERSYLYRDIKERATELEETNRKLAETQNQIIEAEKMSVIGEITSAVAHELRNPLTIIGGFANLMHKNLGPGSGDSEYLNIIISETQRAEAVLTDVLDFSRASKTRDRRLELNNLLQNALTMLGVRLGNGKCKISWKASDGELPLWGNPDQLLHAIYQVFWSLSQDLSCDMPRITSYAIADTARIDIAFPGGEKDRDKVTKVLHQYFGAGNSSKRLSLLVAEETLKHHGGMIGIESTPDEGPILYIQLPLCKEKDHAQDPDS